MRRRGVVATVDDATDDPVHRRRVVATVAFRPDRGTPGCPLLP